MDGIFGSLNYRHGFKQVPIAGDRQSGRGGWLLSDRLMMTSLLEFFMS